jgi:saccharopine dehydrogenase-like NADP-dependent oxidoreductase
MKEKTLRYPGHARLMRALRDSGFFENAPVEIDGQQVRPLDLTSKLLFEQWKLRAGEEDLLVLQVILQGYTGGDLVRYTYDLLDRYDRASHTTSMARTTGYTCAIVARQVASGLFAQKGICPPEYVGRTAGCYGHLLSEYARRGISLAETVVSGG